jgi:copper chaperone CopZ
VRYFKPLASTSLLCFVTLLAGCQQPGAATTESEFQDVTVEVLGMACSEGCAPRAEEALASIPWTKNVKVHFEAKRATLKAEKARYDEKAILKALEDAEFEAKIVK